MISRRSTMASGRALERLAVVVVALSMLAPMARTADAETVTFRCEAPGANAVFLAGSFNEWSPTAQAMSDADGDGVFEVALDLETGAYPYKFVIDGTWTTDETAAGFEADPYGGRNSIVYVGMEPPAPEAGGGRAASPTGAATAAAPASSSRTHDVTFRYEPVIGGERDVFVAGTFNGWVTDQDRLTDADADGVFTLTMPLAEGRHDYKFVVDGNWMTDENAVEFADDGFGGRNSVLIVDAQGQVTPERAQAAPAAADGALYDVTFTHVAPAAREAFLAGSFNDWSTTATPMTRSDDGTFSTTLVLSPGSYPYKFVVDGTWTTDETADQFVDDGFGGRNSVIVVDERFTSVPLERGDGLVYEGDIQHTGSIAECNMVSDTEVVFRARAYRNDVDGVSLMCRRSVEGPWDERPMTRFSSDAAFDYFEITYSRPDPVDVVNYGFLYRDGDVTRWLGPRGFEAAGVTGTAFLFNAETAVVLDPPGWVRDGVFYQIFPDRFRNGDRKNDQKFEEWYYEGRTRLPRVGPQNGEYYHFVKDWDDFSGLAESPYRSDGKPDYFSFYGGDIQGVMDELDYLADLGITIIYFNPLNEARSNHKYDATDYMTLDPHFADPELFARFVAEAHERGIRIVVDTVFNHTGDTHWAFQDAVKKGRESEYWDWYEFKRWPLPEQGEYDASSYYACWWGFGSLPDLNYDLVLPADREHTVSDVSQATPNQPVVDHLLEVATFWIQDMDIDGFRLDVPNEVPFWFWKIFCAEVRRLKSDVYIVCEIWGDATTWITPDLVDATMNYRYFRDPVLHWIGQGQGNAVSFDRELAPGRVVYAPQSQQVMMNLIDSHDTVRFRTQARGDARRLKLAALFQMTYVGAPHIYYGDEVAMEGGADPDCRRPFRWSWTEDPLRRDVHDHYAKLIDIRKQWRALRRGTFTPLVASGNTYAYLRQDTEGSVVVVLNNGEKAVEAAVPLDGDRAGAVFVDAFTGERVNAQGGELSVAVPPVSGRIFTLAHPSGS